MPNVNIKVNTNIPKFRKYLNKVISNYDKYYDTILEDICKEIVYQAKERLILSGYNVSVLLDNITYRKYGKNKYRVGIKSNKEKDIMYFLEFGTGIIGKENPHPQAKDINWNYISNPENIVYNPNSSGINSIGDYVGQEGWFYFDNEKQKYVFTSGLRPIRYFYDTINESNINKIVNFILNRYKGGA